jgi:short-subunit dehydrogenase
MSQTTPIARPEPPTQTDRQTLADPGGNTRKHSASSNGLTANQGGATDATPDRERTARAADEKFRVRYGRWALVTGASAGIGAEFARQLASKGLNLLLVARRAELLDALAGELARGHDVVVRTLAVDLTDPDFLDPIREAIADLDVGLLVNNAGTAVGGGFLDTDLEQQRRSISLNVLAPLALTHQLAQGMRTRGRGGIIFLSSPMALQGVARWANFAATKSYDFTLAEGLAYELKPQGIDVLSVLPGPTLTEGTLNMGAQPDKGPLKFTPPDGVVAETLAALGRRSTVVPGRMNRLTSALMNVLSRSARTKLWAKMMAAMAMTGDVSSPQLGEEVRVADGGFH